MAHRASWSCFQGGHPVGRSPVSGRIGPSVPAGAIPRFGVGWPEAGEQRGLLECGGTTPLSLLGATRRPDRQRGHVRALQTNSKNIPGGQQA